MPQGVAILVGKPQPLPQEELLAATSVEVTEVLGQPSRFALRFAVGPSGDDLTWVSDDRLKPGANVRVDVPGPGSAACLVQGPVTGAQLRLVHGGSGSMFEVVGGDVSITMDRETKVSVHDGVTESELVTSVLSSYSLVPDVERTTTRYSRTGFPLVQRETDLQLLQRLARKRGASFWVDCDARTGLSTGHWKRLELRGSADHDLVINQDGANLQALDIRYDVEQPASVLAAQLDIGTLGAIDGDQPQTPRNVLGQQGLKDIHDDPPALRLTAPVADAADLTARAEGAALEADLFVFAEGETTASALGGVLRAHTLVDLKGAGTRHSGTYLVTRVRHTIDSAGHRMRFELARNGWGS